MTTGKERIDAVFAGCKKPVLIAFTVAGDPTYQTSLSLIREMAHAGADIIEFGLPFSDPVADGPVIQRADLRAMESGMNTDRLFSLVKDFRADNTTPVVILTYANLIIRRGISRFYKEAASFGIDGIVIADVPYEESLPFRTAAEQNGIVQVMMVSPTTSPERLDEILKVASGFIYLVAVMGITGVRTGVDQAALDLLRQVQKKTPVPVAPGFGISTTAQVQEWAQAGADAVIVGSAIVTRIEENLNNHQIMLREVSSFIKELGK